MFATTFFRRVLLACLPAAATLPIAAQSTPPHPATIQRELFSADTFAAIEEQFSAMKVVFETAPAGPTEHSTTHTTGTGPTGFRTVIRIDRVARRFHAYAARRRPQHAVGMLQYRAHDVVFGTTTPGVSPESRRAECATAVHGTRVNHLLRAPGACAQGSGMRAPIKCLPEGLKDLRECLQALPESRKGFRE